MPRVPCSMSSAVVSSGARYFERTPTATIFSSGSRRSWVKPNHFHLLLRTGPTPIARVMRQLLSDYAGRFNRAHRRAGHLFQIRYKSILCQENPNLLELVRYIHLNPLRTKQVATLICRGEGGRADRTRNRPDPETRQTTRPRLRQKTFMPLGHPQFRHGVRGRIEDAWNQPASRNPSGLSLPPITSTWLRLTTHKNRDSSLLWIMTGSARVK
jgi:hypothetical protein